jgi:Flp pilus assembly protein TadG
MFLSKCEDCDKMVKDMFAVRGTAAPREKHAPASATGARSLGRLRADGERGAALVEFAMVVPLLMFVVAGFCGMGILLNQYLELTNATTIGAQYLSVLRGPSATDPCAQTAAVVAQAAPLLNASNMTFYFSITFQNSSTNAITVYNYTGTTCTAAVAELSQGEPVKVTVLYPPIVNVFGYYSGNILPSSWSMGAQTTAMSQ